MVVGPKASSTPKLVHVNCRPPIRDCNNELMGSPINNFLIPENARRRHRYPSQNDEDEKYDSGDSNDETEEIDSEEEELLTNTIFCNCLSNVMMRIVCLTFFVVGGLYWFDGAKSTNQKTSALHQLAKEFPSQVEDFWLSVDVGIEEIMKLHQPKTFLFLYDNESQKTADKIIYKISKDAVCILTNCKRVPVILEGNDLNTTDILEDYGKIVVRNKKKLEESGVMIIKNLEKIPGVSAQAFHSFCDEYNPLVEKALFIFTMKVDRLDENNAEFIENYLRKLWNDIKDDRFYPLFTRISSNVLPIMVEH